MAFDLRDLRPMSLVWLLDIESGGDVIRLSTEPLEAPTGEQGAPVAYFPGLEFAEEVPETVDPFGDSPGLRSVDLSLYLDHLEHIDTLPALIDDGFDIASARGLLRLYGRTSGTVSTVVDGVFRGVEYGLPGDPLTCSLEEVTEDDPGLFPPADAKVTVATWPNASDKAIGERYPWVLGEPGEPGVYTGPGIFVDTTGGAELLLVAGHEVQASSVVIVNDSDNTFAVRAVTTTADGNGRFCSTVNLNASGITIDTGDDYFVRWGNAGGGLLKEDGALLRGAGDVVRWMLGYSKGRIDSGRVSAATPFLNGFQIDTVIQAPPDSRFSPWEWLADHLLPILPVDVRGGPGGHYLAVWRHEATGQDPATHIDVDGGRASLVSSVSYSDREDVANEIALSYKSDPRGNKYHGRAVVTGDVDSADPDARSNLACIASRSRYRDSHGAPEVRVMEESSEVIWSDATAGAVLAWWAQRYALQARLVGYQADAEVCGHLEPGDRVTVTHSDMNWTAKPFLVESATLRLDGQALLDLREIVDPAG